MMLAIVIVFFMSFIYSYFHGYYLSITINDYGEANFEIVLLSIIIVLGCYSLGYNLKKFRKLRRMKIKIRKKEEQEAGVEEIQEPYIQPREQLHNVIKAAEYISYQPISNPSVESIVDEKNTVDVPKRDIKEIERLVDELIYKLEK